MENSLLILCIFNRVVQDFWEAYQSDDDPSYILKSHLDYDFFVRNRCPDWAYELDLLDFQIESYFDKYAINHLFNLACYQFFKDELSKKDML